MPYSLPRRCSRRRLPRAATKTKTTATTTKKYAFKLVNHGKNGTKVDGEALDCALYEATENHLGWEVDGALKGRFHEHVLFSLEAGYAKVTDRIPLENVGLNSDGTFFTLQSRIAYEF